MNAEHHGQGVGYNEGKHALSAIVKENPNPPRPVCHQPSISSRKGTEQDAATYLPAPILVAKYTHPSKTTISSWEMGTVGSYSDSGSRFKEMGTMGSYSGSGSRFKEVVGSSAIFEPE